MGVPFLFLVLLPTFSGFSPPLLLPRSSRLSSSAAAEPPVNVPAERFRKNRALYTQLKKDVGAGGPAVRQATARKPKILAPAGGWTQLRAAVAAGADAVYFGCNQGLNARARAENFNIDELATVTRFLHERGVEGYMCLNVLLFDSELEMAEDLVRQAALAGVDAIIVQDVGLAIAARRIAPGLPVHASTQMSVSDGSGAQFAATHLGAETVVVGRELSVTEITSVVEALGDLPGCTRVEAFVHGALCVSYSGQCLSSESWGGRSANRGQCAQACRMPYGLIVNGALRHLIDDASYLLSPQDFMGLSRVPELVRAGVDTFKIEGRLKGAEYVFTATRAYRDKLDQVWDDLHGTIAPSKSVPATSRSAMVPSRQNLAQIFSRGQDASHDGFTVGFLDGPRHQSVVRGRAPKHRGLMVGEVVRVLPLAPARSGGQKIVRKESEKARPNRKKHAGGGGNNKGYGVVVHLKQAVKRGDGIVFDSGHPEANELGGSIFGVFPTDAPGIGREYDIEDLSPGMNVVLTFGSELNTRLAASQLRAGDLVWRTKDVALEKMVASAIASDDLVRARSGVVVDVSGAEGTPLTVTIEDSAGRKGVGETSALLEKARKKPLTKESLTKALGTLGDSPFSIMGGICWADTINGLFVQPSEIKAARRAAVQSLLQHRADSCAAIATDIATAPQIPALVEDAIASTVALGGGGGDTSRGRGYALSVLCRSMAQVEAAINVNRCDEIIVDFLEAKGVEAAISKIRTHGSGKRVVVAAPRILKPDEHNLYKWLLEIEPDAILVRSAGLIQQLVAANSTVSLQGDFSLNAANQLSVRSLFELVNSGCDGPRLESLTPSYDLNAAQLANLQAELQQGSSPRDDGSPTEAAAKFPLECVIHQHLPIFHTEHCVFCRFLSEGNSYIDCGHPCESNTVHLRSEGTYHRLFPK
jgi:putative protease